MRFERVKVPIGRDQLNEHREVSLLTVEVGHAAPPKAVTRSLPTAGKSADKPNAAKTYQCQLRTIELRAQPEIVTKMLVGRAQLQERFTKNEAFKVYAACTEWPLRCEMAT
jgi:hypothetical protein